MHTHMHIHIHIQTDAQTHVYISSNCLFQEALENVYISGFTSAVFFTFTACEMFGKSLRRQTALVQLAKGVRGVLRNSEDVATLLQDWRSVDAEAMVMQPEACNTNVELFRECEWKI